MRALVVGLLFVVLGPAAAQGRPSPDERRFHDLVGRGNQAYRAKRFAEAASVYEQALVIQDSPAVHLNLGHARFGLKQWDKAIAAYAKAGTAEVDQWIARCHLECGRLVEAHHALLLHLVRRPQDEAARRLLAHVQSRRGRHAEAAEIYRSLLAAHPADPALHRRLAAEALARNRSEEALDALQMAWFLGERSASVARLLGDLYLQADMHREAARYYRKYLAVAQRVEPEDLFRLGCAYFQAEEYVSARRFFRRAVAADPASARAHVYLGNVAAHEGQPAAARQAYEEALKADPRLGEAHVALGNLDLQERRYREAAAAFTEALRLGRSELAVHRNRVVALVRAGEREAAIAALKEALHAHPLNAGLLDLLKLLGRPASR